MNQARLLILVVGISCLAIGAMLGWVASIQTSRGSGDGVAAAEAARADRVAAARAAVQAEGWARVANAAQTLAKGDNDQAQAARRQAQSARQQAQTARQQAEAARQQARDFAARAEKAAGRAAQIAAQTQKARIATAGTVATVPRVPATAAPRAAAPKARSRVAAKPAAPRHLVAAAVVSEESCRRAAIFERTAASSSASREAAYNASVSGIAVNAHCREPERSLIGAYLLAQRASAEIALKNGDWKSDLSRSDRVLSDCVRRPQHYGPIGRSCRARLTKNAKIRLAAH
jgi:hypothetical protein